MSKDIEVQVTQRDIDNGIKGDPCNCPVARALKRAFHERTASAGMGFMYVGPKTRRILWRSPAVVTLFVSDFDEDRPVDPISFNLPSESTYFLPGGQID